MNTFFEQLGLILRRYSLGQRVVITIVMISMISAIVALVLWANRPEFRVLYSDLDPSTANKIVTDLQGMKIKYRVENNGRTILVPGTNVVELRLKFAESGYVGSPVAGYEIFDNSKIGMTSFMQQLNMRRALEGELTKTINRFPGVKNSRVHLVLPDGKLFEERKKGSASVVLYLQPNAYLSGEQVRGIVAIVSNSADGIEPEGVVVVDSKGNLLSKRRSEDSALGSVGNRWDLRHSVENKLRRKVTDLVEGVVGYQNAVVEVSVDLDFQKIERTMESYDPENVVVISEERHTETSKSKDSTSNIDEGYSKENVITNYELNKTVEHYVSNTGTINRLSVAVLVDGTYETTRDEEGNEVKNYIPRSNKELNQITALVKSAVGYNEDRGDMVEVQNVKFDDSTLESEQEYFIEAEKRALWAGILDKGLIVIGVLVAFFLVRTLLKSSEPILQITAGNARSIPSQGGKPSLPEVEEEEEDISEDIYIRKLSPEARAKLKAKDKMTREVVKYSKESPDNAAKLIRSWITNTESG